MKRLAFSAFTVFLVFCIHPLCPEEKPGVITSIEITGLKRTKQHIARYPLEKFLGYEASDLDLNEIHATVIETGILQPLEVELVESGDGFVLHITVEEKWSIFPVPLVMLSSGDYTLGLFFADTNAFGLRDIAAVGGIYGPSSWMALALYQHTPNRIGLPGFSTFFMYGRDEREDADKNEKVHRRYTVDQLRFSLGLNYPFTEYLSSSLSLYFTDISLKENAAAFNQPESGAMLLGISPSFTIRDSNWDGFLLSQRSINLTYEYNHALSGSSFHEAQLRLLYEQPIVPGFRANFKSGAIWKSLAGFGTAGTGSSGSGAEGSGFDPLFEEGPHRALVDILPNNFSARTYAGFSAGLEKHLLKVSWGTLSVMGAWQGVFSDGPISGFDFSHGPYIGTRFYLSRLALPAFGAGLALNTSTGIFQFAFNIGMEF